MGEKGSKAIITLILLFSYSFYSEQCVFALSGNDWQQLSKTGQSFYVVGVLDTWENLAEILAEVIGTRSSHNWKRRVSSFSHEMKRVQPSDGGRERSSRLIPSLLMRFRKLSESL